MKADGNNAKNASGGKDSSHPSYDSHPIIPPRGDYQTLHSFHKAEVVYDLTFRFAHKYLVRGDRTVDQMIQAARSGKKNLLEGSKAALTSKETEIKLTNVGRASRKSCWMTTAIICACVSTANGTKTPRKPSTSAGSDAKCRKPTSFTANSWKPARRKPSPILPSA